MITFSSASKCSPTSRGGRTETHTAGEALAGVVVGVALELEGDARGEPTAEALAGRAAEADVIESGGSPSAPRARAMWLERMPPTQRLTLRIGQLDLHTRVLLGLGVSVAVGTAAGRTCHPPR